MSHIGHELLDNLFFPALGTNESPGFIKSEEVVGVGEPLTWDTNNGMIVVYDDMGYPWIRSRKFFTSEWEVQFANQHSLKRGANVPHSNDGGTFKQLVLEQTGVHI